jgi:hypothetical protein
LEPVRGLAPLSSASSAAGRSGCSTAGAAANPTTHTLTAWIQIRGLASLVDDDAEGAPGLAGLIERYPQYRAMDLVAAPLLCIEPLQIIAWRASPS